jgi:hypothetical protein
MIRLLLNEKAADDADARASWFLGKLGSRIARDNPLSKEQSIDRGLIIGSRLDRLGSALAPDPGAASAGELSSGSAQSGRKNSAEREKQAACKPRAR